MKHIHTFENFLNEGNLHESMSFEEIRDKYEDNPYGIGANSVEYVEGKNGNPSMLIFRHDERSRRDQIESKLKSMGIPAKKLSKSTADRAYKYRYELTMYESEMSESHYAFLGGNSNFTDDEMRKNVDLLNEGKQVFVSDPKFKDETTLKADILKNVGPAINDLLARQGVKYHPITAKENRGRIEFDSKPMTGNDLGFMQYGFTEVWLNTFGGGNFPQINKAAEESFEFSPYIWFNLHYDYKHVGGGSNGCPLYFSGEHSSNVFYDIIAGKFLTNSEAEKRKDWQ